MHRILDLITKLINGYMGNFFLRIGLSVTLSDVTQVIIGEYLKCDLSLQVIIKGDSRRGLSESYHERSGFWCVFSLSIANICIELGPVCYRVCCIPVCYIRICIDCLSA